MDIAGSTAFVTGANGGIGRAFVAELLKRDAAKIYIAARDRNSLSELLKQNDARLVPIKLDVTNVAEVSAAADAASDAKLLINNAGYAAFQGAIAASDLSAARREMDVNYFGPLALTRAFKTALAGGSVVNMLSMAALVSLPVTGTYSASKAAFLSVTRSIRAELAGQGTTVVGVLAVQTESAIGARLPPPRMTPVEVAADALDAVQAGKSEEIAAGSLTHGAYEAFTADPKAFQAKMSMRMPQPS
jgi:short-subunit dehydrogenase